MLKQRIWFMLAMALGAAIWFASPVMTGHREPWDARSPYYILALTGTGAMMGVLQPRPWWLWGVAIYAGQCIAVFALTWLRHSDLGLFVPLGMFMLAIYTGLSFVGSAVGAWLRRIATRAPTERIK